MPAPALVEARWLPAYAVNLPDGTTLEPGDTRLIPPAEARQSDHWEILDDPESKPLLDWKVGDLRDLADDEGVDLAGATKKEEIVASIEADRTHRAELRIRAAELGLEPPEDAKTTELHKAIEQHETDRLAAENADPTAPTGDDA
jgi:hypothetical protein